MKWRLRQVPLQGCIRPAAAAGAASKASFSGGPKRENAQGKPDTASVRRGGTALLAEQIQRSSFRMRWRTVAWIFRSRI